MTAEFTHDAAATAAIFGFFATTWYGWAMESPPAGFARPLGIGILLGLVLAIAGGILAWQHWSDGTVFDRETSIRFGIVVAIEFALCAGGAVVLRLVGRPDIVPGLIAFVVGAHFVPLAIILSQPLLHAVAGVIMGLAIVGTVGALWAGVSVSAVVGAAAGTTLLLSGAVSLAAAL